MTLSSMNDEIFANVSDILENSSLINWMSEYVLLRMQNFTVKCIVNTSNSLLYISVIRRVIWAYNKRSDPRISFP